MSAGDTKTCGTCGQVLPRTEFHVSWSKPNGTIVYRTYCKACNYRRYRQWAIEHPAAIRQSQKRSAVKHAAPRRSRCCRDCGADISGRGNAAKRCAQCVYSKQRKQILEYKRMPYMGRWDRYQGFTTTREVWAAVTQNPQASVRELAVITGYATGTIQKALLTLNAIGYVLHERKSVRARTIAVPFVVVR